MWAAVITGPDAGKAVAEMVAGMYDASLDQYLRNYWTQSFWGFRSESSRLYSRFENNTISFSWVLYGWDLDFIYTEFSYRHFPYNIVPLYYGETTAGGGAAPAPGGRDGTAPPYSGYETDSSYSEDSKEQEVPVSPEPTGSATSADDRLVIDQIINLKKSGVSDETIQKMLDREERERARYYGVTRMIKHPDGSESKVYGDLKKAPFPDTEHHYLSTSEYLESLSLSINGDDTLTAEEKKLWESIFGALRLKKDIE